MPRRWTRQPQRLSIAERLLEVAAVLGILALLWALYTLVVVVLGAPR